MARWLTPRALQIAVWTLALSPAVWFTTSWLFTLRARLTLGRWPSPYNPDPKDLGFDFHYMAIVLGMGWFWSATFVLLLSIVFFQREMRAARTRPLLAAITAFVSVIVIHFIAKQDPGNFFYWFAD